jgi:hypothetical protein
MVERIVLTLVVVAVVTARAEAQPVPAPQAEPPPAAEIPLAPPSMTAPHEPAPAPPAASKQWYGWQILIGDAAVLTVATVTQNPSVAYGWVGSGAIVHLFHGNAHWSFASAALRAGLPIVGAIVGVASAEGCKGDWCGFGPLIAGGVIGMVSAEAIDVAAFAYDSVPTPTTVRTAQHSHGVEVSPVVRAGRSGFGVDLVGRF